MSDIPDRILEDPSQINLSEEHEVRYWAKSLEVTEEHLRTLVERHGHSVEAVMTAAGK